MKKVLLAGMMVLVTSAALAQAPQPFQKAGNFRLGDVGRFHGYLSQPVFCGIAKCGDNWRVPGRVNGLAEKQRQRRR
jgi:hypothetical protein